MLTDGYIKVTLLQSLKQGMSQHEQPIESHKEELPYGITFWSPDLQVYIYIYIIYFHTHIYAVVTYIGISDINVKK